MPNSNFPKNDTFIDREHAACGVAILVNMPSITQDGEPPQKPKANRQIVAEGLELMKEFEYRSGWNTSAGVSDGVGGIFYGLPTAFFNKKIHEGAFSFVDKQLALPTLEEDHFAIGQYFFENTPEQIDTAKALITEQATRYGLNI